MRGKYLLTGILLTLMIFAIGATKAQPKKPPPKPKAPAKSRTDAPGLPEELAVKWQICSTLAEAYGAAKGQEKPLYVYFYFNNKEDFPINYDESLQTYSEDRAVFAKIFVKTDSKNKIVETDLAEFFKQQRLVYTETSAFFDYYGNFLFLMSGSVAANKVTASVDNAGKKIADIESDFNRRLEKAAKLEKDKKIPDMIKVLNQIVEDKYQGYPAIEKAQDKLKELDRAALTEHYNIIKAYHNVAEDEREPEKVIKDLEVVVKSYKTLPAEKIIQSSIDILKKGELPPLPKEPPKEEPKKEPPKKSDTEETPIGPPAPERENPGQPK